MIPKKIPRELKYMNYQISLKVLLLNKKGETLLLDAINQRAFRYDLPGGRINASENNIAPINLIKREIREELGSKISYSLNPIPVAIGKKKWYSGEQSKFLQHYNYKQKNLNIFYVLFAAQYKKGPIQISSEHSGYHWEKITSKKIKEYFYPALDEAMRNYFQLK